ncbi:MAG: T9SS type A sorting domain-containing protein [Bacteroidota bacterium]
MKDAQLSSQQEQIRALMERLATLEAFLLSQSDGATAQGSAAQLWQNEPNPTNGSISIRYFIPHQVTSAQLKVYALHGQEVHSIELKQRGAGHVQLSRQSFAFGLYEYHLFIDGQSVASKKLLLKK